MTCISLARTSLLTASTLLLFGVGGVAPATQPSGTAAPTPDCCMPASPAAMLVAHVAPATQPAADAKPDAKALFEKLKGLVGHWEASAGSETASLDYTLTGNGSAVVETDPQHGGMLTIYTLDAANSRVLLTHYCAAGNQPRMASTGLVGDKAIFDFLDATGMANANATHMHNAVLTFLPGGKLRQTWTMYQGGKAAGDMSFDLTLSK